MSLRAHDLEIRTLVYRSFVSSGRAPTADALAGTSDRSSEDVAASLGRLARARELVLLPGGETEIWMAHPFSAVPTDYPVESEERGWWANCAWDALAIPPLVGVDATTSTTCPDCEVSLVIETRDGTSWSDGRVVHFAVPARRFWDDIGFT